MQIFLVRLTLVAFSRKSSIATVVRFFNMIGLYIYIQWETRTRINNIKKFYKFSQLQSCFFCWTQPLTCHFMSKQYT